MSPEFAIEIWIDDETRTMIDLLPVLGPEFDEHNGIHYSVLRTNRQIYPNRA
jgi:hypothetical protein